MKPLLLLLAALGASHAGETFFACNADSQCQDVTGPGSRCTCPQRPAASASARRQLRRSRRLSRESRNAHADLIEAYMKREMSDLHRRQAGARRAGAGRRLAENTTDMEELAEDRFAANITTGTGGRRLFGVRAPVQCRCASAPSSPPPHPPPPSPPPAFTCPRNAVSGTATLTHPTLDSYEVYCDGQTFGGGWALALVVSNKDGNAKSTSLSTSWWDRCTPGNNWASATPVFGDDPPTPSSTTNAKGMAYSRYEMNEIMICEEMDSYSGCRRYELSGFVSSSVNTLLAAVTATSSSSSYSNKASASEQTGDSWSNSAFMQYTQLSFSGPNGNDMARIQGDPPSAEASPGIACSVDGGCGYNWKGNLCKGGGRHYNSDSIVQNHAVYLYVRAAAA